MLRYSLVLGLAVGALAPVRQRRDGFQFNDKPEGDGVFAFQNRVAFRLIVKLPMPKPVFTTKHREKIRHGVSRQGVCRTSGAENIATTKITHSG